MKLTYLIALTASSTSQILKAPLLSPLAHLFLPFQLCPNSPFFPSLFPSGSLFFSLLFLSSTASHSARCYTSHLMATFIISMASLLLSSWGSPTPSNNIMEIPKKQTSRVLTTKGGLEI